MPRLARYVRRPAPMVLLAWATLSSCSGDSPTGLNAGPPAALLIEAGQDQSAIVGAELSTALTVRVVDAEGRVVRGQIVNFRVVSGGGSVFAGAAITSDSGLVRERWTLGTAAADSQRVEARAVDANGSAIVFGIFRATAWPDVPAGLVKVGGDSQVVVVGTPATDSLAVRVVDRFGNPVPETAVRWAVAGGGSLDADSVISNAQGIARTRWTVGQVTGVDQRVSVQVGSLTPLSFTASLQSAEPVRLAIVDSASGAASGAAFTTVPRVRLVDAFGNTADGTNAITISASAGGTLIGNTLATPVAGVATFTGLGLSGAIGEYTLTFSSPGLTPESQSVILVAGAPTQLLYQEMPSGAVSGVPFATQPVLEVRDAAGNLTVSATSITASMVNDTTPLLGTRTAAVVDGVARFTDLQVDRAGSYTLSFGASTLGLVSPPAPIIVAPSAPTQLALLTAAAGATDGAAFVTQPVVEIQDAAANRTGSATSVTLTVSAGGTVVGTATVVAVDGRATFTDAGLSGPLGDYSLTFSASGLTSVTQTVTLGLGAFRLASNGVTILCPTAAVGATGVVNGVTYTKRNRAELDSLVAANNFAPLATTCTSGITDMRLLFYQQAGFNTPIGSWDVSSVTTMSEMFYGAAGFNQPIEDWDVSNVSNMDGTFHATTFNQPIGKWDVGNVATMNYMFLRSSFNQPIGDWDVSNVRIMSAMFSQSVFNQPIGSWNVSNVTNMAGMFAQSVFNQPIGSWNVSNVTTMDGMFYGAAGFNQPIGAWDVGRVTSMFETFSRTEAFNQPIGNWNVGSVTNMRATFERAAVFNQPLGAWDVSNVTSMALMFDGAPVFNQPIAGWNTAKVTNMNGMFANAASFNQDISSWNVSLVSNMLDMFRSASIFNRDLSGWCVSLIPTEPLQFALGAASWTQPKPVWGTCPTP